MSMNSLSLPEWLVEKTFQGNRWKVDLLVISAALLLAGIVLIVAEFIILRSSLLEELDVQMKVVRDSTGAALVFNDKDAAGEVLDTLKASPSVDVAVLYDVSGGKFAEYRRDAAESAQAHLGADSKFSRHVSLTHVEYLQPIQVEGNMVGTAFMRANMRQLYVHLLWYVGTTVLVVLSIVGAAGLVLRRMRRMVAHAEERVGYLAYFDTVTQLPNRHAFNERFEALLKEIAKRGHSLSLLFLDLDDFKVVNDTLGHHIGDLLLKVVAEKLSACVRQGDAVYRIGGDEFAMILADVSEPEAAAIVAEKFIRALNRPLVIEGQTLYVSASIGISTSPHDGTDTATLLRNADAAMYFAKERGKNNFQLFSKEMHEKASLRLALEGDLRHALERKEFELHYQPIVDLASGRIVAVEALIRWNHKDKGMVSPNAFIPLAETTGLIVPIGEWVLREACTHAKAWHGMGHDVKVSVNLSGRQFREESMIQTIQDILRETGLDPKLLELEITESVLMEHAEVTVARLYQLKDMGIYLSIDDFGTGYSSMTYLKRFPVGKLKIDQSFIRDIPEDSEDVAITAATIQMAHSLRLKVVAEGIETQAQADFLKERGCDLGQGYLFSRPLRHAILLEHFHTNLMRQFSRSSETIK